MTSWLQRQLTTMTANCNPQDCTLREAVNAARAADTIKFNIPGPGPHVIEPTCSELPAIISRNALTLDGYSQPGAHPNTAAAMQPGNASIQIVLNGDNASPGSAGVHAIRRFATIVRVVRMWVTDGPRPQR
jgi:hypothetical protein